MTHHIEGEQVWLITGAATGLGLAIAEDALARGHKVVATARGTDRLQDLASSNSQNLLACQLDVTSRQEIDAAVASAIERFGRIDVLVNNAAAGLLGAIEESSSQDIRDLFDCNVFGPWELIRAVLPHMRCQRSGTIVNVSSFAALCAFTGLGAYSATKFALEGMSEALASEIAPWGIRVVIAQPGGLNTDFASHSIRFAEAMDEYEAMLGPMRRAIGKQVQPNLGDPKIAASVIATAVAAERPPLRLPLGADAIAMANAARRRREQDLSQWESLGRTITPAGKPDSHA